MNQQVDTIFESNEEFNITTAIINALNEQAAHGVDDFSLVNAVLAAGAIYSHYAINKKQLGMFLEQDKEEILAQMGKMIDQISINKGQCQVPLPN